MPIQQIISPRREGGSFRDPSGFVFFKEDGTLCRQVNFCYREHYDYLISSGLYQNLVAEQLLIVHEEVNLQLAISKEAYRVIQPHQVPFISYPYEWCFSQLKDAALLTLAIQQKAIEHGMVLKDASAYNIQFYNGKPILIDTLSFEIYQDGRPWVAYKQFCQHFLAPLALMGLRDIRLNQLLRVYMDGIPLDLTVSLLPLRAYLRLGLLLHIYLHNKTQKYFSNKTVKKEKFDKKFSRQAIFRLIDNLESLISGLVWKPKGTEWADYQENNNYKSESIKCKKCLIAAYLDRIKPKTVWDLGANTGVFSRIATNKMIQTASFDIDPAAVEKNYLLMKKENEKNLLPLLMDLTNPSPAIGWNNEERKNLNERGPVDTIFALALIHHLALIHNVPFERIASFFARFGKTLAIEFVPKDDLKVQSMLASRESEFVDYTIETFENAFKKYFSIVRRDPIKYSSRILYLMQRI